MDNNGIPMQALTWFPENGKRNNNNNNKQVFQKRTINDESSKRHPWRRRTRPNAYTSTFSVNA